MLTLDILTLFPEMFQGPFAASILKKAQENGHVKINLHQLRDWAVDDYGTVDERPYGGGKGMVLRPEPIFNAIANLKKQDSTEAKTILLTPQGEVFNQEIAGELAQTERLILICGHYEGVDERVREHLVDREISIGDYVLSGGEIPAMVLTDAVVRLVPGVLETEATANESFSPGNKGRIEYPQYTRPEEFQGWKVPKVLLSGDHLEIKKWRARQAVSRTASRRPELLGPKSLES